MNYPYKYEEEARFRADLFRYYGVADNPKADKAYAIAWDYGHASGYQDVQSYFSDIVELIK